MPPVLSSDKASLPFFDPVAFKHELQKSDNAITVFKEAITKARHALDKRFLAKGKIEDIIHQHTLFIDQILITAWQRHNLNEPSDLTLLAVGGYGRGELHPYSDIDIQILLTSANRKTYKSNIERFLTFLWDINLEVGQSVRTIKENKSEAAKDITIVTALAESRTLSGSPALHEKLMIEVGQDKIWKTKAFFSAKKEEQEKRHERHNDISYALEPNIKLAPGGLRDFQTIGWIAKRYYGTPDLYSLVKKRVLQKNEYQDLIKGRNFLWKVRYGLHMITDRREDRLLFEHQRNLAELFGYKDDKRSLAIEKLMQRYYRVVLTMRELNDVLLQLFDEDIIRSKERTKISLINDRFQIRNNYIETTSIRVFRKTPSALIEIFVLMAQDRSIEGIRASTIRLIRNARSFIDSEFRKDPRNKYLFMALLSSPHRVVQRLRQMKRYGLLSAYLPEFEKIIGQMQHDLFHIYTVDDHTLQVMENMRRLRHSDAQENFPLAAQIVKRIPKIELLYVAGLYHDIAKGRGGDHSVLGAVDAEQFCQRHFLGKWDTNIVCWLVKNHLVMSSTAQREDIQDPDVIKNFARKVGDNVRLDYLYVLTVCDINATNPELWTSWRASLMRQLYTATRRALSQGMENIVDKSSWIQENKHSVLERLAQEGISKSKAAKLWKKPDNDYFFREKAEDIVWHTKAINSYNPDDGPLVLLKNNEDQNNEGATQIFIYALRSRCLFANISSAFDRLNLNIHDARIYNTDSDFVMHTFMVLNDDGSRIDESNDEAEGIKALLTEYSAAQELTQEQKARPSRKQRHFTSNTATTFTSDDDHPYSILEVLCPDRPGLLAKIATIFVARNIVLHNVKITTLGEQVEDVFYISNQKNQQIKNKHLIEQLEQDIRITLDEEISG